MFRSVLPRSGLALMLTAALTLAGTARADGPRDHYQFGREPPRLPAPFVVPALSHSTLDLRMDWFVAQLDSEGVNRPSAVAAMARPSAEANVLVPRRLFFGATYPIASVLPPDGGLAPGEIARPAGARTMLGNLEGHVRALFPLPEALEIGFLLGVVLPTSTFDRRFRPNQSAAAAVSSLDPTNYIHFQPDRFALRPAGDLRIVRGPLVLQGRQGIDIVLDDEGIEHVKTVGRLLGHIGYLVRSDVEVSVEASQVYFFSTQNKSSGIRTPETEFAEKYRISDGHRTALTIGPALSLALRDVDVGFAMITHLNEPLSPAASGFLGLRVSVIGRMGSAR